jgi:hypothetical protein
MIRPSFAVILLCTIVLAAACGKSALNQPGLQGENSVILVRDLASAYERRDINGFMEKVAPSFPGRAAYQQSIEKVFAVYQTINFTATSR